MERRQLAERLAAPSAPVSSSGIVASADPAAFISAFAAAVAGEGEVFLADPRWGVAERSRLEGFVPDAHAADEGWLMIPTGGSGGGGKFARHDGRTIAAAVAGFQSHFGMERVNALSVLPLHHVSGFMAWMRCLLTGGAFVTADWKDVEQGKFPAGLPAGCCLSLVPTQLQRLLGSAAAAEWLRSFAVILVGGGPSWAGLLEAAAELGLPLAPSYGSTETAAMAAALTPEQFRLGMRGCGRALPHTRIELTDGLVWVRGESVFRGYYPARDDSRSWLSGDRGRFGADGSLVIEGRVDDVVITGGEKVWPAEVEEALRQSGEFDDVVVLGVPDPEWGELLVACHPAGRSPRLAAVERALTGLAGFKRPKRYVAVEPWPRDAHGKVRRGELARRAGLIPM